MKSNRHHVNHVVDSLVIQLTFGAKAAAATMFIGTYSLCVGVAILCNITRDGVVSRASGRRSWMRWPNVVGRWNRWMDDGG